MKDSCYWTMRKNMLFDVVVSLRRSLVVRKRNYYFRKKANCSSKTTEKYKSLVFSFRSDEYTIPNAER
jgi:hypothetical protein